MTGSGKGKEKDRYDGFKIGRKEKDRYAGFRVGKREG